MHPLGPIWTSIRGKEEIDQELFLYPIHHYNIAIDTTPHIGGWKQLENY